MNITNNAIILILHEFFFSKYQLLAKQLKNTKQDQPIDITR
jgi:hypothetical protein